MRFTRQKLVIVCIWLLPLAVLTGWSRAAHAATPSKQGVMETYRSLMAQKCRINQKKKDLGNNIFNEIRLSEKWIRIRHIQKGWKGWVRVHAICRVPGGTAWGYADLQLKSGEVICESENWDSMITPADLANR